MNLLDYLPGVPNFPKPGILFRDISPLLANPAAFKEAIAQMESLAQEFDYTHILGIESRGFIFGSALAHHAHIAALIMYPPSTRIRSRLISNKAAPLLRRLWSS